MANLADMLDIDDLEHRYLGKLIVYVEAQSDAGFFSHCVGTGHDEDIEFKAFPDATGAGPTIKRVRQERQNNPRVFALVDGEAAVSELGGFDELLACDKLLFQLDRPDFDGVIYLSEHEMENIVLRLADIAKHIVNDTTFGGLGNRTQAQIDAVIAETIERQFDGAICKYATVHLSRDGKMGGAIGVVFWDAASHEEEALRKRVLEYGGNWEEFSEERLRLQNAAKRTLESLTEDRRSYHKLRIADGKTALKFLADHYKVHKNWQGHLTTQLVGAPYFDQLRDELFEIVEKTV